MVMLIIVIILINNDFVKHRLVKSNDISTRVVFIIVFARARKMIYFCGHPRL